MVIKRFLFETKLGDLVLKAFERLTGLALVDLDVLDSWRYGIEKPEPVRQH
jgi:hypothetical protein